jgi:hypothetical protein
MGMALVALAAPEANSWPLLTDDDFMGLLWQALGSPYGLLVQASNPDAFRQRCYVLRRNSLDERLKDLTFRGSPFTSGNLCIVKQSAMMPKSETKKHV